MMSKIIPLPLALGIAKENKKNLFRKLKNTGTYRYGMPHSAGGVLVRQKAGRSMFRRCGGSSKQCRRVALVTANVSRVLSNSMKQLATAKQHTFLWCAAMHCHCIIARWGCIIYCLHVSIFPRILFGLIPLSTYNWYRAGLLADYCTSLMWVADRSVWIAGIIRNACFG